MKSQVDIWDQIGQGLIIGASIMLFMYFGPIVWNVDLPDWNVLQQGFDKIDWYCGNAFIFESRCYTFRIDNVATILIPNSLEFITEL